MENIINVNNRNIKYIKEIWKNEDLFKNSIENELKNKSDKSQFLLVRFFELLSIFYFGITDFILAFICLGYLSLTKKKRIKLLFIAKNFCVAVSSGKQIRIAPFLFEKNTILFNSSKEARLRRVGGKKVYNIGFFVKFISLFGLANHDLVARNYRSYEIVNNIFLRLNVFESINFYWFYDLNSFSIIFSKYRHNHKLVEIQHGSIINYPPYALPAPVKIADVFYVRNKMTISYLKNHLCKDFECEYKILDYPVVNLEVVQGLNILYASTIEFQGFHPVFKSFLQEYRSVFPDEKLNLTIRLHPRERGRENLFINDLQSSEINFKFDNSENWLLSNAIEGLIVISPWSSTLEEAFDNGYRSITIDEVGRKRFSHFISEGSFLYSDNLIKTLGNWDYRIS